MDKRSRSPTDALHFTQLLPYQFSYATEFLRSSFERIIAGMPKKYTLVLMRNAF